VRPDVDIVIPVYNEGRNIHSALDALEREVRSSHRITLVHDDDTDDTLPAVAHRLGAGLRAVRNRGRGAFDAVVTGLERSDAPFVVVYAADDGDNAARIDEMVAMARSGPEIVVASRFVKGGNMVGAPLLKSLLVRAAGFALHRLAGLPVHDPSNGFRLFSRRVIERIPLESSKGFTYSIEYLVKCHRLGWPIAEVPVVWYERRLGQSRFRVIRWLPGYLRWARYAFATRYLRRGPATVRLHPELPR
jgi:glycosyltransferase involved in cell wall biosynthesis